MPPTAARCDPFVERTGTDGRGPTHSSLRSVYTTNAGDAGGGAAPWDAVHESEGESHPASSEPILTTGGPTRTMGNPDDPRKGPGEPAGTRR